MIELLWNAPVSERRMAAYVEALELPPGAEVLDVGCGCGEVLRRVCERYAARGLGIDVSEPHVGEARRRAGEGDAAVRFEVADADGSEVAAGSLDLVICLGATHAFGLGPCAYENALRRIVPMLKSGGRLLVADGYLKRPASAEYRTLLGDAPAEGTTHEANVAAGVAAGLTPLGAWTSSTAEWDDFEWGYQRLVEAKAGVDAAAADRLAARREWMAAYLREGRATLGYGTYLFGKP